MINNLLSFYNKYYCMTWFVIWKYQSQSHADENMSEIFRVCKNFANFFFSLRIWIVNAFFILINFSCNFNFFLHQLLINESCIFSSVNETFFDVISYFFRCDESFGFVFDLILKKIQNENNGEIGIMLIINVNDSINQNLHWFEMFAGVSNRFINLIVFLH